jgi:hypothetical protein
MGRISRIGVALAAVAALASPAFAESKISGYYRVQAVSERQNIGRDIASDNQVDNRFRLRYQNDLNEYLYFVYFGEVDTPWGEQSKGGIGAGGKANADGVNVETKSVFIDFKFPASRYSVRTGIQGFGGNFDGVVIDNDAAGIRVNKTWDRFNLTANYFKLDEGERDEWDDNDLYALQLAAAPSDTLKVAADVYFLDDNDDSDDLQTEGEQYYVGLRADQRVGKMGLAGWLLYNGGKIESNLPGVEDVDVDSYAASVKATYALHKTSLGLRLLYFPADDSSSDDESFNGDISGGEFEFYDENLQIFLTDAYYNNTAAGRRALVDAAYAGFGLFGAAFSGKYVPVQDIYAKWGLGYFLALDDRRDASSATEDNRRGTTLGAELSAQIGMIVADKVDISLRGAYAYLGDFYDGQAAGGSDPDDLYKVTAMIQVPFSF